MAHSRSAKKRIRQNVRHRARNRWRKQSLRGAIRDYRESILHGTVDEAQSQLSKIYKELDQFSAKGAIHSNQAARYKSRLTARLNAKRAAQTS
jgi:small subunit ribosomal protein S20